MIYYIRSDVDNLIGFKYNNELYYYVKNNFDDITGILDSNYNVVAKYTYDSFGNILSITDGTGNDVSNNLNHIANINPFRYRSYYYDKETGLYYLNARYYNPLWGRFINADGVLLQNRKLTGNNLYLYCDNDPVNKIDESGNGYLWNLAKSVFKKTVKVVSDVYNFVSGALTWASKQKKKIEKVLSNSYVKEVGVGNGFGNKKILPVSGYADITTVTTKDDKYQNISGSMDVGNDFFSIGITYTHEYPFSANDSHSSPFSQDMYYCDNTKYGFSIKIGFLNLNIDADGVSFFVGIESSKHFGFGGHYKQGWDFKINMG